MVYQRASEEEKTARDIVYSFQLVKDDPAALLGLDRDLGARGPDAATEKCCVARRAEILAFYCAKPPSL